MIRCTSIAAPITSRLSRSALWNCGCTTNLSKTEGRKEREGQTKHLSVGFSILFTFSANAASTPGAGYAEPVDFRHGSILNSVHRVSGFQSTILNRRSRRSQRLRLFASFAPFCSIRKKAGQKPHSRDRHKRPQNGTKMSANALETVHFAFLCFFVFFVAVSCLLHSLRFHFEFHDLDAADR